MILQSLLQLITTIMAITIIIRLVTVPVIALGTLLHPIMMMTITMIIIIIIIIIIIPSKGGLPIIITRMMYPYCPAPTLLLIQTSFTHTAITLILFTHTVITLILFNPINHRSKL